MCQIISGQDIHLRLARPDEHSALNAFGETFDHKVPSMAQPIVIFSKKDVWIAFSQVNQRPVVHNAFHPKLCSPRDVVEISKKLKGYADLAFGGGYLVAPIKNTSFSPEIINKLGYKGPVGFLYESIP